MSFDLSAVWARVAAAGWSDAEFARRLGYDKSRISRLRNGHSEPTLRFRESLRRVFPDVHPDALVRVVDAPPGRVA
jgi:transcriptional regulator with XRE-family HTH domain